MKRRGTVVIAAAVLLLAVAILLGRPLVGFRSRTFGPFQLMTQHSALTHLPGPAEPTNTLLSDPASQMHPWALFAAGELGAGRFALWNPYNAAGAPLFANYQSALLSPFTLPYYVLGLKAAVLASALLKLLVAGTFAYLFLRRIACTVGAALLGAVAFAASGFCMTFIQYPHVGVFALLPMSLFFAEALCARLGAQGHATRSLLGPAAGLALALGLGALGGHPETLLYCYVVVAGFSAARLIGLAAGEARRGAGWRGTRRACAWLSATALVGLALGAVQILPFAEYLARSSMLLADRGAHASLPRLHWPLHFFPNLAGTPMVPVLDADLPGTNYQELTSFFVGGVVLLCALIGALQSRASVAARFFTGLVVLWAVYAYDVFGACAWLGVHTPLRHVPVGRTHPLWAPSACFLAALGVSALEQSGARAGWRRALACLALAGGLAALFHWGAERYLDGLAERLRLARGELPESVERHLASMEAYYALGAAGLVALAGSARSWLRIAGHAALIAAVLVGSAASIADYVPTVRDEYVYPRTEATEALRAAVGEDRLLVLSTAHLPAEVNLLYGVRTVESYDAVGVGETMRLINHLFGGSHMGADPRRASKRGLELLGVRYVATHGDWVPIDTDLGDFLVTDRLITAYAAYEWLAQAPFPFPQGPRHPTLTFELEAKRDGLDGIAVQFVGAPEALDSEIAFRLTDVERGRELASGRRRLGDLPSLPHLINASRRELALRFEPVEASKGRKLALEISSDGKRDARPKVVRMPWLRGGSDKQPLPMIDLGYGQGDFELVRELQHLSVYRYEPSPGKAWIVGQAVTAASHEEAFELVTSSDFHPLEQVVLEGVVERPPAPLGPFELAIEEELPCRWRFAASCATPGWLVLAQAFYPGWKARVDGEERELLRANYALTGLELPAGEHQIELVYDPPSFRIGAWCSALAAGLIACGALLSRRRRPPVAT